MPIRIAVPHETTPGERRVALIPSVAKQLTESGIQVRIQAGAGCAAFYRDRDYDSVEIIDDRATLLREADILLTVNPLVPEDVALLREGTTVIGFLHPHEFEDRICALRDRNITGFAMELIPRISRAQNMDALSSQASIGGYKAALMAANRTARFFPMLTTAAGTIRPAKVLIIGVGVAGLQAIATAKRLGAMVEAYDVRPETREQVESLGAKFVDVKVNAVGEGGYARELSEDEKRQEMEILAQHVANADAIISTAGVPGRPAPKIITTAMVEQMKPGSVIIDMAAYSGGMIYGPLNIPAMMPVHASEMYAKNLFNFLSLIVRDGVINPDWDDEIVAGSLLTRDGRIKHGLTCERVEGSEGGQS
jgi:NAD(P) transhydrogenase subunit alpha